MKTKKILKVFLILIAGLIALLLIVILAIRYYIAPHNVNSSMRSAFKQAQISSITDTPPNINVNCHPSEFETICESSVTVAPSTKTASTLESYIDTATKSLKEKGWGIYQSNEDTNGNRFRYRNMGIWTHKFLGTNYCEVVVSYNSANPDQNGLLTYNQTLHCSQSLL